jgi:hypothetical protein
VILVPGEDSSTGNVTGGLRLARWVFSVSRARLLFNQRLDALAARAQWRGVSTANKADAPISINLNGVPG